MTYHILNGDALAEKFPAEQIGGKMIVIGEAFIEGPLSKQFSDDYWEKRFEFVNKTYEAEKQDYERQFFSQLEIMDEITGNDEVFMWFEDDLFCIANMLFAVYYLSDKCDANMYRVFPEEDPVRWKGFGYADKEELFRYFKESVLMAEDDKQLACKLWEAYVDNDIQKLKVLSHSPTNAFRFLPQVIEAHLERFQHDGKESRPQQTLINILNEGKTNFYEICDEFWKKEAIYGFGDLQVYNMLKEMEIEFSEDL